MKNSRNNISTTSKWNRIKSSFRWAAPAWPAKKKWPRTKTRYWSSTPTTCWNEVFHSVILCNASNKLIPHVFYHQTPIVLRLISLVVDLLIFSMVHYLSLSFETTVKLLQLLNVYYILYIRSGQTFWTIIGHNSIFSLSCRYVLWCLKETLKLTCEQRRRAPWNSVA